MGGRGVPIRSSLFFEDFLFFTMPHLSEFRSALTKVDNIIDSLLEQWSPRRLDGYQSKKEGDLEDNLIRPMLRMLGFEKSDTAKKEPCYAVFPTLYGTEGEAFEPDYAIFASGDDMRNAQSYRNSKDNQFFTFSIGVGDAKAWNVDLDKKKRGQSPAQQILKYLVHSGRRYGFLTNGRLWRLYRATSAQALLRPNVHLEIDIDSILQSNTDTLEEWHTLRGSQVPFDPASERRHWLAYFILFFGPNAYIGDGPAPYSGLELVERIYKTGIRERSAIQDDLKERVFNSLLVVCRGFYSCPQWKGTSKKAPSESDLKKLYSSSLLFLYRLLFILNAESRGLLDSYGYRPISLSRLAEDINRNLGGVVQQSLAPTYTYWKRIKDIFTVIADKERANEVGVTHYDGGLFDSSLEGYEYLEMWQLDDDSLFRLMQHLVFKEAELAGQKVHRFIDYGALEIRHLGQIYEGLLEYKLRHADKDLFLVKGVFVDRPPKSGSIEETIYKNDLYLATDKLERKVTGTYYTPDHIVDYIVQQTLTPLCKRAKDWKEILDFRILDPAMGSGHFLVAAIDFLAGTLHNDPKASLPPAFDDEDSDELLLWKRLVAEQCIYGVDRNPLAVELAKLSVWLATANRGKALSFLDAQLLHGDSLLGTTLSDLDSPPLERKKGRLKRTGQIEQSKLTERIQSRIEGIARMAEKIDRAPAFTAAEIAALREAHRSNVRKPLESIQVLADVWMNQWFLSPKNAKILSERTYAPILEAAVSGDLKPQRRRKNHRLFFHWELAFPHILAFGDDRGFDAIIGNPPYEVLASKEIGKSVEEEKFFFRKSGYFGIAAGGKLNLFSLFIARSLHLLKAGGMFSFIVPLTLLGFNQTLRLRKWLLACDDIESLQQRWRMRAASFVDICAFPQKDDPTRRVFRDAKQATCIFVASAAPDCANKMIVRTYPGGDFDDEPKRYELPIADIGVIDVEGAAIPHSATEADLRIAVRAAKHSRFTKLGTIARVSQGEFNITNSKKVGITTEIYTDDLARLTRGAHIARYKLQEAKQGIELYVVHDALEKHIAAKESSKFHDIDKSRLIFQESSPADNYRRLIAVVVSPGTYCGHTVNYVTDVVGQTLHSIAAVFNSSLSEWRFRLTATTNHVSGGEIKNMSIPIYSWTKEAAELARTFQDESLQRLVDERLLCANDLLLKIRGGKVTEIERSLKKAIEHSSSEEAWDNEIHDVFAAFSMRLHELGQMIQAAKDGFLNWIDDFLDVESRSWVGSSSFRRFENIDFRDFMQICLKNSVDVKRTHHQTLKNEFEDANRIIRDSYNEMNMIEDIIDESLFDMLELNQNERTIIQKNSGRRIPLA